IEKGQSWCHEHHKTCCKQHEASVTGIEIHISSFSSIKVIGNWISHHFEIASRNNLSVPSHLNIFI
ncbi:MAG: hypothetical protein PHW73_02365, partial [Atribacterota bacterium]|nr:hypothetical protein [Atribacterota bacterium]